MKAQDNTAKSNPSKVQSVCMRPAENGFVIEWQENIGTETAKKETYSDWHNWVGKQKVFSINEKDKAIEAFIQKSRESGMSMDAGKEVTMPVADKDKDGK